MNTKFIKVNDIEIPDIMFNPIQTGNTDIDNAFSELGGIIPSQVTLFTAEPGAGKTSIASYIGGKIASKYDNPAVFLSYEMSDFQLKLQARKIEGFKNMLISTEFSSLYGLLNDLKQVNPSVVIVDSIQKMTSYMEGNDYQNQTKIVEAFTKFAKLTYCPVILIGHLNKSGSYVGPSKLKHEVDSHIHINIDKKTGHRTFMFTKNRFGSCFNEIPFKISSTGLSIGSECFDSDPLVEELLELCEVNMKLCAVKEHGKDLKNFTEASPYKEYAQSLMFFLINRYKDKIDKDAYVTHDKITLSFDEGLKTICQPILGNIVLGEKMIMGLDETTQSMYKREAANFDKWVKNKEDALTYIIMHEFQHLFKGYHRHTVSFFKEVDNLCSENKTFFSSYNK